MKVVLFCGGMGLRLRESGENIPKPLAAIGYRPILWHVMKYYAHYGHKDFILCLGYRGDAIKNYFLRYDEYVSNDFVLSEGGKSRELVSRDIEDWKITFVDTGTLSNVGQRLKAVEEYLHNEDVFLANYADGLTDLPLPQQIAHFRERNKVASLLCVHPKVPYHLIDVKDGDLVSDIRNMSNSNLRINGGYFVFKKEIFDYIKNGEELVEEPFRRLAADEQLIAFRYDGFWACMDTYKDKQRLDDLYAKGGAPWQVWRA